jgi:hypothetical protein
MLLTIATLLGVVNASNTPDQFAQDNHAEIAIWSRAIKEAELKLE